MKKIILSILAISSLLTSCSKDNDKQDGKQEIKIPDFYQFKDKDGKSTVEYAGQEARLKMAAELKSALGKDGLATSTLVKLNEMFKDGKGFSDDVLNNSGKKIRPTVASATNSILPISQREDLRAKMDGWIKEFADVVIPAKDVDASSGVAGNLNQKRFVNSKGIEANQAFAKTFIGAVVLDQVVNKYLSKKFIDDAKADNDAGKLYKQGKNYTKLEHGWDEAYGYIFGVEGTFLNKYLGSVNSLPKFKGIKNEIKIAFIAGRNAIVLKRYDVVYKSAKVIRTALSKAVAVKTVSYLLKAKGPKDESTAHAFSEAYGFCHAMMFAHAGDTQVGDKIKPIIDALDSADGFWSITDEQLDGFAEKITSYYDFTTHDVLGK